MKKPRLVHIIAIINSILVIYMLYTIHGLKQNRRTPQVSPYQQETAIQEQPTPDELLTLLETTSTAQEKLQTLHQLPVLQQKEANRLHQWLADSLLKDPSLDRLERLDAIDAAYRSLITSAYDTDSLAVELQNRISDATLWLPERNQALIHLFLLYAEKAPPTGNQLEDVGGMDSAGTPPTAVNPVSTPLAVAIETAKSYGDTSLAATCIDGGLYLNNSNLENPAQDAVNELARTALISNFQPSTQLNAIKYAQACDLDIVTQAAGLLQNSENVSVAIAAKRYLVDRAANTHAIQAANATVPPQ